MQRLLLGRRQSSEIMNHYSLSPRYFDAVAWENVCKRYLGAACTLEDAGYPSIWGMVADNADWYVQMVDSGDPRILRMGVLKNKCAR